MQLNNIHISLQTEWQSSCNSYLLQPNNKLEYQTRQTNIECPTCRDANLINGFFLQVDHLQQLQHKHSDSASCLSDNQVTCWGQWDLSPGLWFLQPAVPVPVDVDGQPLLLTPWHCIGDRLLSDHPACVHSPAQSGCCHHSIQTLATVVYGQSCAVTFIAAAWEDDGVLHKGSEPEKQLRSSRETTCTCTSLHHPLHTFLKKLEATVDKHVSPNNCSSFANHPALVRQQAWEKAKSVLVKYMKTNAAYLMLKVSVNPKRHSSGFCRQGDVSSPRLRVPFPSKVKTRRSRTVVNWRSPVMVRFPLMVIKMLPTISRNVRRVSSTLSTARWKKKQSSINVYLFTKLEKQFQ